MKKIFNLLFIMLISLFIMDKAYALSTDKTDITLNSGGSTTLTLKEDFKDKKIKKIEFNLVYYSYDIKGDFIVNNSYNDVISGVSHQIKFEDEVTGEVSLGDIQINVSNSPKVVSSNFSLNNVKALTTDGEEVVLDDLTIRVKIDDNYKEDNKVTPVTTSEEKNLLEKIESNIVSIDLKDDVYSYNVKVDESLEELDLKAVAKDDNVKVEISTQKIEEVKNNDNKITIKASKGDKTEEYTINVLYNKKLEVDNSEYKPNNSYKNTWLVLIFVFGGLLALGAVVSKKVK